MVLYRWFTSIIKNIPFQARSVWQRHYNKSGFSIMEILAVITIIGIMLAIAVPNMKSSLDYHRVKGAAAEMASDIRFMQQESVSRELQHKIIFVPGTDAYTLYRIDLAGNDVLVEHKTLPVNIELVSTSFDAHTLSYERQGSPYSAGWVELAGGSGHACFIVVSSVGQVRVDKAQP